MSSVPKVFSGDYYDEDYFKTPEGKKFLRADGSIHGWSYANPDGEFTGAKPIAEAWKEVFNPIHMLDVGCGRGTFIAYARDTGIEALGFDYSGWAVNEGRYARCKPEWVIEHDATVAWPYRDDYFDLVAALDFYEHIYEKDIAFVISEMFRVARKHLFLQIATVDGVREVGYKLEKGEQVPVGLEGLAVAGHVTVQTEEYWLDRLYRDDWYPRRDMVEHFCGLVDNAIIRNWLLNSIIIMEKEEE